jgi:hypothetical protein
MHKRGIKTLLTAAAFYFSFSFSSYAFTPGDDFKKEAVAQYYLPAKGKCISSEPCFVPSINFPKHYGQKEEKRPWSTINYKSHPEQYLNTVLQYVLEGNLEVDWQIHRNQVRTWYHAPWMHTAREPIHGLTRERGSRWHELSPHQIRRTNNWAVGFYNEAGGYTLGQVWKDVTHPNSTKVDFPVGTVSAKLLFTDATDSEAPFLAGKNLVWEADIHNNGKPVALRLLQLDVLIKEEPSKTFSGWVFGTFVYNAQLEGAHYWQKLQPVGLEWGSSPNFGYAEFLAGGVPPEGWINPQAAKLFAQRPPDGRLGYLGRMNGPVDSPLSSCTSCHSRALDSRGDDLPDFHPKEAALCLKKVSIENNETFERIPGCSISKEVEEAVIRPYYRNLKSDEAFVSGYNSLDYSLQLAQGIVNWHDWFKSRFPKEYDMFTQGTVNSITDSSELSPAMLEHKTNVIRMVPSIEAFKRGD